MGNAVGVKSAQETESEQRDGLDADSVEENGVECTSGDVPICVGDTGEGSTDGLEGHREGFSGDEDPGPEPGEVVRGEGQCVFEGEVEGGGEACLRYASERTRMASGVGQDIRVRWTGPQAEMRWPTRPMGWRAAQSARRSLNC